ncbi:MAG: aminotransferase class I/II-fold pyridoxal phosphate-dependent enzyme [Cellulomonadaceae bacterium]|nr:aminotransferase class I/II-fold pyridoxal phosphate-dependent enzyme [Cellulomonadaceae bacterium]
MSDVTAGLPQATNPLQGSLPALQADYAALCARGLALDLTRGKPAADQLALSEPLLSLPGSGIDLDDAGTDVRNYGGGDGLPGLRRIFAPLYGVPVDQFLALGNASLHVMHDVITFALLHGLPDSPQPWAREETLKFICPVPGYDRHHSICQAYGIDMIPVPMQADGPDAAAIAALVASDPAIKGMWLVPTYSNPSGAVVTDDVAQALVSMPTAAPDFRIFWDNAYAIHHLTDVETPSADALALAAAAGNPDRVLMFASTSKVSFAGSGIAFFASSPANIDWLRARRSVQTIGPDKINHLRHALFFRDSDGVRTHMRAHAAILAPKFAAVQRILTARLGALRDAGLVTWTNPQGGYFVSLNVMPGTAARVIALAKQAGVALTPAGATWPLGVDPRDENIRLAPSMPPLADVEEAMEAVALCVQLAAAEVTYRQPSNSR